VVARLSEFRVDQLFGLYSHQIAMRTDERITAIIGPNGRGKTVCLKMIEALFTRNFSYFLNTNFAEALYSFTDGQTVRIRKVKLPPAPSPRPQAVSPDARETVQIDYSSPGSDVKVWHPINVGAMARRLRRGGTRVAPFLVQFGPDIFHDERTGETLSSNEAIARYAQYFPNSFFEGAQKDEPEGFRTLITGIKCHLIETQRLLVLPAQAESETWAPPEYEPHPSRASQSKLVVQEKAEKLKAIIQGALTQYATLSQSRDRTFPRRVIQAPGRDLTESELRHKLEELDRKRRALMGAGVLDTEFDYVAIEGVAIEEAVAKVLEIYVKDNEEKLTVFDTLLAKIDVFTKIVNERFIDKEIKIDRQHGFMILSRSAVDVPLDKLSSGEQHQLVIAFDLLFEVEPNSLILIDEPELSMHVLWQKNFIEGLQKMIELNNFDVILATHSPVLIARHGDLVVELGDVEH
jgi:predicted ATP-binding protein involved in virulence